MKCNIEISITQTAIDKFTFIDLVLLNNTLYTL